VEKLVRLVRYPVCGHTLLVGNAVEALTDAILPSVTLITPNKSEAKHKQKKVSISGLADLVSVKGTPHPRFKTRHVATTMAEVHELLATNPAISVYEYGLLGENMNLFQFGHKRRIGPPSLSPTCCRTRAGLEEQWRCRSSSVQGSSRRVPWFELYAKRRSCMWARKCTDK